MRLISNFSAFSLKSEALFLFESSSLRRSKVFRRQNVLCSSTFLKLVLSLLISSFVAFKVGFIAVVIAIVRFFSIGLRLSRLGIAISLVFTTSQIRLVFEGQS